MKKFIALFMALALSCAFVGCGKEDPANGEETKAPETQATETKAPETEAPETQASDVKTVMSHAEYIAAEMQAEVTIEAYVQATQSWWDNKITVYAQDEDGAYYLYEMACSEEDSKKLTPGTKIKVTGFKGAWEGEVEIMDATFELIEGEYIAEALDVTDLLGKDELINHQNKLVAFKGLTVEAIEYKNGEPGDDVYLTLGLDGASYDFCVEIYLTGEDSDVYKTVAELEAGDVVDVEGFLYWYQGANPHVTAITVVE